MFQKKKEKKKLTRCAKEADQVGYFSLPKKTVGYLSDANPTKGQNTNSQAQI